MADISTLTPTTEILGYLDAVQVGDWADLVDTTSRNERILRRVASNRAHLRALIERLQDDESLFAMCEKDEFRYKLVLYTDPRRKFRLRLHMWRSGFTDCAHGHRFNYTTFLLNGGYRHTLYDSDQNLYPQQLRDIPEVHFNVDDPKIQNFIDFRRIKQTFVCTIEKGQCYTQHHSLLSSTVTQPDTISLFIRGPAQRDSSIQWDVEANTIIWRRGVTDLTPEQRMRVTMTRQDYATVYSNLERLGLI